MTDPHARLIDGLAAHGILRRVECVRARMRSWNLTAGDPGHIDADELANLDHSHPLYMRADHPALAGYYARITAEGQESGEPDDPEELRRRAGLEYRG